MLTFPACRTNQTNQINQINQTDQYDALILAVVPHQFFLDQPADAYLRLLKADDCPGVVVDVKGVLRDALREANLLYWSL